MDSSLLFGISTLAYFIAMAAYICFVSFRKNVIAMAATTVAIFGFVCQSGALVLRWIDSYYFWMASAPTSSVLEGVLRGAPLRNLYESLVFFVWSLVLALLIIEFVYKNRSLGAFVMPVAALALAFIDVSGMSKDIQPLIPALQSNWLLFHVLLSFLGYAAFAVSFGAALAYVVIVTESRHEKAYIFWSITVGIFLVVLIAMGFDYLSFTIGGQEDFIRDYFLKASFKNESGVVMTLSWIVSFVFIALLWRFGLGLKRVLSSLSLTSRILDEIAYKSIAVGFPLFTIGGVIMGAIWANSAWGTYWSWDPKETWSLITWFIYAVYLHARFVAGWRGKKVAVLALVGFIGVVFTYLGVNLFLSGLHSYGGG
jgi:cytochrome c-type biogenesis protein CcsB